MPLRRCELVHQLTRLPDNAGEERAMPLGAGSGSAGRRLGGGQRGTLRLWRAVALSLLACTGGAVTWTIHAHDQKTAQSATGLSKINHIVIILKENRSFDHYFGRFPGADGATSGLLPDGRRIPLGVPGDVVTPDIWHGSVQALQAIDNGKMDGFTLSPGAVYHGQNHSYTAMR